MTFRVGQKVVYVGCGNQITDALITARASILGMTAPTLNAVYTVRVTVRVTPFRIPAILLNEIINAPHEWEDGHYELGMNADFFRPVVERKTDISIFTALLNPSKQTEKA